MKTTLEYSVEDYRTAILEQEKLIERLEAARPTCTSNEYLYWQPRISVERAVLNGLKNPFRGLESIDSFAGHGGVNVDGRLRELRRIRDAAMSEEYEGQRDI